MCACSGSPLLGVPRQRPRCADGGTTGPRDASKVAQHRLPLVARRRSSTGGGRTTRAPHRPGGQLQRVDRQCTWSAGARSACVNRRAARDHELVLRASSRTQAAGRWRATCWPSSRAARWRLTPHPRERRGSWRSHRTAVHRHVRVDSLEGAGGHRSRALSSFKMVHARGDAGAALANDWLRATYSRLMYSPMSADVSSASGREPGRAPWIVDDCHHLPQAAYVWDAAARALRARAALRGPRRGVRPAHGEPCRVSFAWAKVLYAAPRRVRVTTADLAPRCAR